MMKKQLLNLLGNQKDAAQKMAINKVQELAGEFAKKTFGFEFTVNWQARDTMKEFKEWISKYKKDVDKLFDNDCTLMNKRFVVKFRNDTYLYVATGSKVPNLETIILTDMNSNSSSKMMMYFYAFGKKASAVKSKLVKIFDDDKSERFLYKATAVKDYDKETLTIYRSKLSSRTLDTLFYENNIKEECVKHIEAFIRNASIYEERSLLYKTGILLSGDPGTGKSSLAQVLARHFDFDVMTIDMTNFERIDLNALTEAINQDDKTYVVILEDFDCVMGDRTKIDAKEVISEHDEKIKKNINKLLQFLDSPSSPNKAIFVATTNHREILDPAILRDGRFDLKLYVTNITKETSLEMGKSFGLTNDELQIMESQLPSALYKEDMYNQSKLQNIILTILSERTRKDEFGDDVVEEQPKRIEDMTEEELMKPDYKEWKVDNHIFRVFGNVNMEEEFNVVEDNGLPVFKQADGFIISENSSIAEVQDMIKITRHTGDLRDDTGEILTTVIFNPAVIESNGKEVE